MTARGRSALSASENRPPTGLCQRPSGIEQAGPNNGPLVQEMRGRVVRTARLSDCREPCHQAIAQILGGGHYKICRQMLRIADARQLAGFAELL